MIHQDVAQEIDDDIPNEQAKRNVEDPINDNKSTAKMLTEQVYNLINE